MPVQLMDQNLVQQLEPVESGKPSGEISHGLQESMPSGLQPIADVPQALRLPLLNPPNSSGNDSTSERRKGRESGVLLVSKMGQLHLSHPIVPRIEGTAVAW